MTEVPEALGFIVLYREHGVWRDDWDGEVHPTREAGKEALAEAVRQGFEAVLTGCHPSAGREHEVPW